MFLFLLFWKLINFVFQIFLLFLPEMTANFTFYIVQTSIIFLFFYFGVLHPVDWLTMRAASSWLSLYYLIFSCCQLPFCEFPKHNRTSLVWHANVLYFCSFWKPTFSGATREWDALYIYIYIYIQITCLTRRSNFVRIRPSLFRTK
jgi:hypothetical protein